MAATLHKAVLAQNSPLLASSTQTPAKAQLHTPAAARASATQQPAAAHHATWVSLGVGRDELSLEFCLPTGQSFRWRQSTQVEGLYTGVIGQRLVQAWQQPEDVWYRVIARSPSAAPSGDESAVREYFNLSCTAGNGGGTSVQGGTPEEEGVTGSEWHLSLAELSSQWAGACGRYKAIAPYFRGARMLRQDPLECLMQFICSSNNHISRIQGMVERLCSAYGTPLVPDCSTPEEALHLVAALDVLEAVHQQGEQAVHGVVLAGTTTTPAVTDSPLVQLSQGSSDVSQPGSNTQQELSAADVTVVAAAAATTAGFRATPAPAPAATAAAAAGMGSSVVSTPASSRAAVVGASMATAVQGSTAVPTTAVHGSTTTSTAGLAPTPTAPKRTRRKQAGSRAVDEPRASPMTLPSPAAAAAAAGGGGAPGGVPLEAVQGPATQAVPTESTAFYAFPTLDQLSAATEEELRAAGFGYRAKFIVGSVEALRSKPGGGDAWLMSLRGVPYAEAAAALEELPGVGPKVAACVCLFSLDKHEAIPVDTHVWQIAARHYMPSLRGKSLTKKLHGEVQAAFQSRFGPYCGWAHNALFISELATQQHRLPEGLRQGGGGSKGGKGGNNKRRRSKGSDSGGDDDGGSE